LKLQVAKLQGGDSRKGTVPLYCAMMRKVVITPSKMVVLPPAMETSNRTIRHYKEHFQFTDENGKLRLTVLLWMGLILEIDITNFWPFFKPATRSLLLVLCFTMELSADDIRERMGDLSNINVVAKYAAAWDSAFRALAPWLIYLSTIFKPLIAEVLYLKSTPSAVQFRLGGYKGVLCTSAYVRGKQIQVRPSIWCATYGTGCDKGVDIFTCIF